MPIYSRPGVFVSETLQTPNILLPVNPTDSVFAIAGPCARGPLVPTQVSSWSEYIERFGGLAEQTEYQKTLASSSFLSKNTMAYAAYTFFATGGSSLWVSRVVPSGATAASLQTGQLLLNATPVETLGVTAANPGTWANTSGTKGLSVSILPSGSAEFFELVVYYNITSSAVSTNAIVERFTGLTMDPASVNYAPTIINSSSKWIAVTDKNVSGTALQRRPVDQTTPRTLTGGTEASTLPAANDYWLTGASTGALSGFDALTNPINLALPGLNATDNNTLYQRVLDWCNYRTNGFLVVDPKAGRTPSEVVTDVTNLNFATAYSSYSAIYYPHIYITDPASASPVSTVLVPPGGAVLGVMANIDETRGIFRSPAGNAANVSVAVGVERVLLNTELDALYGNSLPINPIRTLPSGDVSVMGARTLNQSQADRWVNVRRTLNFVRASLSEITSFAVFENNDEVLRTRVQVSVDTFLNQLWQRGGLRGNSPSAAYFVKCDETNNTAATVNAGQLIVDVGVALQTPAEFILIRVGQVSGAAATITEY